MLGRSAKLRDMKQVNETAEAAPAIAGITKIDDPNAKCFCPRCGLPLPSTEHLEKCSQTTPSPAPVGGNHCYIISNDDPARPRVGCMPAHGQTVWFKTHEEAVAQAAKLGLPIKRDYYQAVMAARGDLAMPDRTTGPVLSLTIRARLDVAGVWVVECPEWNCRFNTDNLTRELARLAADIEQHNTGQPQPAQDWNKFAEREGLAPLRREQWPQPSPTLRGARNRAGLPAPDPGTRTPRAHHWQAPT